MFLFAAGFFFYTGYSYAQGSVGNDEKGVLMSNQSGTVFCCCPGMQDCSAATCEDDICDDIN